MKSNILCCFTFLGLISACISHSSSKDSDLQKQSKFSDEVKVKDVFKLNKKQSFANEVFKESLARQTHHDLVSGSGSGHGVFNEESSGFEGSLEHSFSGKGLFSSDENERSRFVHGGMKEDSTSLVVGDRAKEMREALKSENGTKAQTIEERIKKVIEDERSAGMVKTAKHASSFSTTLHHKSTETTPNEDLHKLGTTPETLIKTERKIKTVISTAGYQVSNTKPAILKKTKYGNGLKTSTSNQNLTFFFSLLQVINDKLNELLKWKAEYEQNVRDVVLFTGKTFKNESSSKRNGKSGKGLRKEHKRKRRSNLEKRDGLSKEIMKKIGENFPCRHPKAMTLIKSGTSFLNKQHCELCRCQMGKLNCEKDLEGCFPKACRLLDGEVVPNLAIHNDGCNNCLCYNGKLMCTHLRCPEAGHHYTNYKAIGLKNSDPESSGKNTARAMSSRGLDGCLECDHLPGPPVCGRRQWKTFPSFCHAMFCGANTDKDIDNSPCETLDPCASLPCAKDEQCIPYYQTPCIAGEKSSSLCHQFKCITKNLGCSKESTVTKVCGKDGKTYSSSCEMFSKSVGLAYKGVCKRTCNSEVCGIESHTYDSRCHAKEVKAHIDYLGPCEYHFTSALMQEDDKGESLFVDERCDLVYEHGRCAPTKCDKAILPPGACCPVCGVAVVVSLNLDNADQKDAPLRLDRMHEFITSLHTEVSPRVCKTSIDLTYAMDLLVVVQPYSSNKLEACADLAAEIVDQINFERKDEETGIMILLGAATLVEGKSFEDNEDEDL